MWRVSLIKREFFKREKCITASAQISKMYNQKHVSASKHQTHQFHKQMFENRKLHLKGENLILLGFNCRNIIFRPLEIIKNLQNRCPTILGKFLIEIFTTV